MGKKKKKSPVKPFSELTFTDDYMFMLLMRQKAISKGVIERILGIKIKSVSYPQTQKSIDLEMGRKAVRLDVYTEDDDAMYTVEMQNFRLDDLQKRAKFYESMASSEALNKGDKYKALKNNFVIFICTFDEFGKNLPVYNFNYFCRQDKDLRLKDGSEIIFVNTKGNTEGVSNDLENLISYIDNGVVTDDFTGKIDAAIRKIKENRKYGRHYMKVSKKFNKYYVYGVQTGREEGREIGIEEGREIGVEEGREIGLEEGREIGLEEGRKEITDELIRQVKQGEISEASAAKLLKISGEEFKSRLKG